MPRGKEKILTHSLDFWRKKEKKTLSERARKSAKWNRGNVLTSKSSSTDTMSWFMMRRMSACGEKSARQYTFRHRVRADSPLEKTDISHTFVGTRKCIFVDFFSARARCKNVPDHRPQSSASCAFWRSCALASIASRVRLRVSASHARVHFRDRY